MRVSAPVIWTIFSNFVLFFRATASAGFPERFLGAEKLALHRVDAQAKTLGGPHFRFRWERRPFSCFLASALASSYSALRLFISPL